MEKKSVAKDSILVTWRAWPMALKQILFDLTKDLGSVIKMVQLDKVHFFLG